MSYTSPVTVQSNMQSDDRHRCILATKIQYLNPCLHSPPSATITYTNSLLTTCTLTGGETHISPCPEQQQEHFWTNWREKKKNAHFIVTGRDRTSSLKPSSPLVLLIFNLRRQKSRLSYLRHTRESTWKYSLTRATRRMHSKPANVTAAQRPAVRILHLWV